MGSRPAAAVRRPAGARWRPAPPGDGDGVVGDRIAVAVVMTILVVGVAWCQAARGESRRVQGVFQARLVDTQIGRDRLTEAASQAPTCAITGTSPSTITRPAAWRTRVTPFDPS